MRALSVPAACALVALVALAVLAAPARAGWQSLATPDFTVFYGPGHEEDAMHALRALEDSREAVRPWTGSLALRVPVTIEDAGLYANGFTDPVYYRIHLFTSPPFLRDLAPAERWWELVGVHEYAHLSHMTAVRGDPALLSAVFGNVFSPNIFSPMWLTEGLATNVESSISPYQGRLNDGFFDAYLLARAKDGRLPSLMEASVAPMEFPGGTGVYLYGSGFVAYLDRTRGRAAFPKFVLGNGGSILSMCSMLVPAIGVDPEARDAFGARFPALWKEWQADVRKRSETFAIDGEQVTRRGWYVSDLLVDGGRLFYKRSYPVKTATFQAFTFDEIVERDLATGHERVVVSTTAGFAPRLLVRNGTLWYGTRELARDYENTAMLRFGYETRVHARDLATGRDRVVVQDRLRAFTVLPDGRLLMARERRGAFGTDLLVDAAAGGKPETWPSTDLLVDDLVANGARVVATARRDGESFSLHEVDVAARTLSPLVKTPWLQGTPALDGDRLLFTVNWGKVYSIYACDFGSRELTRLTRGGFATFPARAGEWLYFVGLNSYGFDIYRRRIEPQAATVPADLPFTRTATAFEPGTVRHGGYWSNLATLVPGLRTPYFDVAVEGGKTKREQYGVMLQGKDAVGDIPSYEIDLAWDAMRDRPAGSAHVDSLFFAPLQVSAWGGNMDGRDLHLLTRYPLWTAVSPGLSELSAGASLDEYTDDDDASRRQVTPFVRAGAGFPTTRVTATVLVPQERERWGAAANGSSVYVRAGLTQYLCHSQLAVSSLSFRDNGGVTTVVPALRGYRDDFRTGSGAQVSVELSAPVLGIRSGLWNPSVWIEDLVLVAFGDTLLPENRATLYSGGVELHLETWLTNMGSQFDWGVRAAWNRDGKASTGVFVEGRMNADSLWRLPRAIRGVVRTMGGG